MSKEKLKMHLDQACARMGLEKGTVLEFIRREWVVVECAAERDAELEIDEEDLARIHLIQQLRRDLGVNDESVPIILHLVDQLHALIRVLNQH